VSLHPQAVSFLAILDALGDPPISESTPEAVRVARKARWRPSTIEVAEIRDIDAGGVPARLYRPNDRSDLGLLVYLHGGGWVVGDLDSHDGVCRSIARDSGHALLSLDYRLAPEQPYPAALEDALTGTRWAHAHASELGCRADRVAIGGDSAGAGMAAVVAQLQVAPLVFQLLVYPVTDCTQSSPSHDENVDGPFLTKAGMSWFIDHYLTGGGAQRADPRVSPLLASDAVVAATPAALVITADHDPLRDEGDAYARRLATLGVPTSHVRFGGMFHGFFSLADFLDDAKTANALAAAAVKAAFER
jgi:acetyl esterase